MVLLHVARASRYVARGSHDHNVTMKTIMRTGKLPTSTVKGIDATIAGVDASTTQAARELAQQPSTGPIPYADARKLFLEHYCSCPITCKVYCGLRMIDMFGHVNNSKYLEIMEWGRWYYMSYINLTPNMVRKRLGFVVSDLSLQYVREIRPFRNVLVSSVALPMEDRADRVYLVQSIYTEDGKKLHASAIMYAALLGPPSYIQHLNERYSLGPDVPESLKTDPLNQPADLSEQQLNKRRCILNTYQALSDTLGHDTIEPIKAVLDNGFQDYMRPKLDESHDNWLRRMRSANLEWRQAIKETTRTPTQK